MLHQSPLLSQGTALVIVSPDTIQAQSPSGKTDPGDTVSGTGSNTVLLRKQHTHISELTKLVPKGFTAAPVRRDLSSVSPFSTRNPGKKTNPMGGNNCISSRAHLAHGLSCLTIYVTAAVSFSQPRLCSTFIPGIKNPSISPKWTVTD